MQIKEPIVLRFQAAICIATRSGITSSTVYSMMNENRKDLSVITVKKLFDGFNITVTNFFDDDIFKNLEKEIK